MTSQTSPQAAGGVDHSRSTIKATQRLRQLFARYKILALLIAVAAIWLFFSMLTDGAFTSPRNLSNLLRQMSITGMLACGMVFVIIAGEIDLSVGSLLGLLGGVAAILDQGLGWPITATVPVVLLLGVAMGLFNGWWSTYRGVPSFIVGLGGMLAYRGILLGLTHGSTIAPVSDSFVLIGQGYLPRHVGDLMAVLIFCLLIFVVARQRREHRRYELDVAPSGRTSPSLLWRARSSSPLSPRSTAMAAFRCLFCSCWRCSVFFLGSPARRFSAAVSTPWVQTLKPHACRALTPIA